MGFGNLVIKLNWKHPWKVWWSQNWTECLVIPAAKFQLKTICLLNKKRKKRQKVINKLMIIKAEIPSTQVLLAECGLQILIELHVWGELPDHMVVFPNRYLFLWLLFFSYLTIYKKPSFHMESPIRCNIRRVKS